MVCLTQGTCTYLHRLGLEIILTQFEKALVPCRQVKEMTRQEWCSRAPKYPASFLIPERRSGPTCTQEKKGRDPDSISSWGFMLMSRLCGRDILLGEILAKTRQGADNFFATEKKFFNKSFNPSQMKCFNPFQRKSIKSPETKNKSTFWTDPQIHA